MEEPIRIAQIMGKLLGGGVEMVVFNYYREIDKSKIQFDFYYDDDSTVEPPEDLVAMGAKFIKIPAYQKLSQFIKCLDYHFKKNKYYIVHSHLNTLSIFPLFVAWKNHVPVRIAHNHSVPNGDSSGRLIVKYILRLLSKVFPTHYFACSEKAARWMFGNADYEKGRVTIIKNAIDFNKFKSSGMGIDAMKNKYNLNDKFVIGHVGRFTYAKNHKFLIDILKVMTKLKENAVLMLVGDGELNSEIHRWVSEAGLDDNVVFVGNVSDSEKYYKLADIMLFPSKFEGLPLVVIESQVSGVPVIASKVIPEEAIISNGCVRMDLNVDDWIQNIPEVSKLKVELTKESNEYDITLATKRLEEIYMKLRR